MQFLPELKTGLYNLWPLMAWCFVVSLLCFRRLKQLGSVCFMKERKVKRFFVRTLGSTFWTILIFSSIVLPLRPDSWFPYVGLPLTITGLLIYTSGYFTCLRTGEGKPFTTGVYRISRHPLFIGYAFVFVGASIAVASWAYLLLSLLFLVTQFAGIKDEEAFCRRRFGTAYDAYREKTRKII